MSLQTKPQTAGDLAARQVAYADMVVRVRDLIHGVTSPGSTVLVVSKGDEELVGLLGRRGWHFLQDDNGSYAGYHPRDSASAIEALEALRGRGADYLAIPATSAWWLEHYADLGHHLRRSYEVVAEQPETGIIYSLRRESAQPAAEGDRTQDDLERHRSSVLASQIADLASYLVPAEGTLVVVDTEPAGDLPLVGRAVTHVRVYSEAAAESSPHWDAEVERLKNLLQRGDGALIMTARAYDWWERHEELRSLVERRYRCVTRQSHVCLIFDLDRAEDPVER